MLINKNNFNSSDPIRNNKNIIIPSYFTERNNKNEDYLSSIQRRFSDIFLKIKYQDNDKKVKKQKVSNEVIMGAIFLKKLGFNEHFVQKKEHNKIDIDKVIEIQGLFRGYFIRNINFKLDKLKVRQCLLELFCLLLHGFFYKEKIRYYFNTLKEIYFSTRYNVEEEFNLDDKIKFILPKGFYNDSRINDLNCINFGNE